MWFSHFLESSRLVGDVSYLSVPEVSMVSGLSSFASFSNYLNPLGNGGTCGGRHLYLWIPNVFLSWFGIGYFLGVDVSSDFMLLFFLVMSFSVVEIALLSPVYPELTDKSVRCLSTTITSGAGASDLVIKFGPLVTYL